MSFTFSVLLQTTKPGAPSLTMEDVECLLALINEVDDHRTYPLESPRNAHHFDPNERTRRIFDSLAEILVHNVTGEVFFFKAGLRGLSPSSRPSQHPKILSQSPQSPRSPCVTTTEKLPGDKQDKIYNLLLAIYRYSSKKYLSRVHKQRDVTKPTHFEIFQRIVNSIGPLNGELGELLNEVSTTVDLIVQDLSSAHVLTSATQDFKDLCGCFEHLAFIVEKLDVYAQELKRITDTNSILFNYT